MSMKIEINRSPITSTDCTTTKLHLKEKEMPAYALEKDAGFCSGGDEDDSEESNQTNSDDSGVKTDLLMKSSLKNKRKCAEPYKVIVKNEEQLMAPLKKRIRFETEIDAETSRSSVGSDHKQPPMTSPDSGAQLDVHSDNSASPFRPWSIPGRSFGLSPENVVSLKYAPSTSQSPPSPAQFPNSPFQLPPHTLISHATQQDEPLSLVTNIRTSIVSTPSPLRKRRERRANATATVTIPTMRPLEQLSIFHPQFPLEFKVDSTKSVNEKVEAENIPRVPHHPAVRPLTIAEINAQAREQNIKPLPQVCHQHPNFNNDSMLTSTQIDVQNLTNDMNIPSTSAGNTESESHEMHQKPSSVYSQKEQRNYKNMTRERRIEANARERTRVHTISAAFDTLRKSIPAYSHNQKLSKLSVLRIACSYIMTLSRVAGNEPNPDEDEPSLSECISAVTRTIQTEGKLRKKKDDV